jgi:hypothetical protein
LDTNLNPKTTEKVMDTQQVLECLLAKMDANTKATQEGLLAMREEIRTNQTRAEIGHKELLSRLEAD